MKVLILDVDPSSPTLLGFAIDPKLSLADIIASLTLLVTVPVACCESQRDEATAGGDGCLINVNHICRWATTIPAGPSLGFVS